MLFIYIEPLWVKVRQTSFMVSLCMKNMNRCFQVSSKNQRNPLIFLLVQLEIARVLHNSTDSQKLHF